MGTQTPGLLARLRRALSSSRTTRVSFERIDFLVPTEHAEARRASLESFLVGKGIGTEVTSEELGNGKTRLRAKLEAADAQKLDLRSQAAQDELERFLTDAVS